ncbi:hypothetical protein [Enterobacter asburiae]|uniref:hypothetical protein n=1 Tax=Enterobacter asburiae TaxID=61645 RepID=UPI000FDBB280|nr:hypothetical protein [Enterobacter asburiae]
MKSVFCALIIGSTIILSGCTVDKNKTESNANQPESGSLYIAGSSFQKIVLSGDKSKCGKSTFDVQWKSKHDAILPKDVFVPFVLTDEFDGDSGLTHITVLTAPSFNETVSKVYGSLLKNQALIKDKSFMNMAIVLDGCSLTVIDK